MELQNKERERDRVAATVECGEGQGKSNAMQIAFPPAPFMFVVAGASLSLPAKVGVGGFPRDSPLRKRYFLCTGIEYFGIAKIQSTLFVCNLD